MHQEVAQGGPLDDGFATDKMRTATDCDASAVFVFDSFASCDEFAEVREAACTVGVGEDDVLASDVSHAVSDRAAFAAILFERDDADAPVWDMCRVECLRISVLGPGSRLGYRMLAQLVLLRKF